MHLRFLLVFLPVFLWPNCVFALEYKTEIAPIEDSVLAEAVEASSVLLELQEEAPPDSLYGLRRRAEDDRTRLQQALQSSGYYDGDVLIRIAGKSLDEVAAAEGKESAGKEPVPVSIEIQPGPLYTIREVAVTGAEELGIRPELGWRAGWTDRHR